MIVLLRDAIAGERLGMGCFTGQTRPLGPSAELAPSGAQGNSAAIRSWLGTLPPTQVFNVLPTTAPPLFHPGIDTGARISPS